jgi:uncharacterized small protein (DUF1192 family)
MPAEITNSASQDDRCEAGAEYLETIALLQEEIARLENELLARDDSCQGTVAASRSCDDVVAPGDAGAARELERLASELASREETIGVLMDQLRLVEEAESTGRAEWEQLAHWVAEVEERVERQEQQGAGGNEEMIAAARRQAEDARSALDRERKDAAAKRRELERRIEELQEFLARQTARGAVRDKVDASDQMARALAMLESENRRLRQSCDDLEESSRGELRLLGERLEAAERDLEVARKAHEAVQDERTRERREFEVAVASLRSQAARASIAAQETHMPSAGATSAGEEGASLDADMRIRAFRQHLKEIHTHEAETRNSKRLGARLSRLWNKTVPK